MSGFGKAGTEEFWLAPPNCRAVIRSRLIFINSGDLSCLSLLVVRLELSLGLRIDGDEKQVLLLGRTKLIKLRRAWAQ